MKKIILYLLFFTGLSLTAFGQDKPVVQDTLLPEAVKKTFSLKYPGQTDSAWVKDSLGYVITFTKEGKWFDIRINTKGKWLESLVLINYEDMPEAVRRVFEASENNKLEILKTEQVENEKEKLYYKITFLAANGNEAAIYYNSEGESLKVDSR